MIKFVKLFKSLIPVQVVCDLSDRMKRLVALVNIQRKEVFA